jgi:hypothetical protein
VLQETGLISVPIPRFVVPAFSEFNHLLLSKCRRSRMIDIQYPEPAFQIRKQGGRDTIFDPLRKRWLVLTPEEWVRQNIVQYLVRVMHYPSTLIAMEKVIKLGELKKRFDILVYDTQHRPWMMIECKEPGVRLDEQVLHQVLRYHISVAAGYLIITNGTNTFGWEKRGNDLHLIQAFPEWKTGDQADL